MGEALDGGTSRDSDRVAPEGSTEEMLGVGALVVGYGAEPVLHGISIGVRSGEAVALLGANRAGPQLFASLDQLRREGMTLLLVDQMAALALALADRAYVMESGHIVGHGTSADIAAKPELSEAYLGGAKASTARSVDGVGSADVSPGRTGKAKAAPSHVVPAA